MKTRTISMLAAAVLVCGLFTGCAGVQKTITPQIVRQGVATGVSYSVAKYPDAVPGVRIGQEVICAAANGTDISPAKIVADIQAAGSQLTSEAVLIINTSLLFYNGVWNSYGDEAVNNRPVLKEYLVSTCLGITDGLPGSALRAASSETSWPLVKFHVVP